MDFSLISHTRGYQISFCEGLLALTTVSGLPYALRHFSLLRTSDSSTERLGHGILAAAELIPALGLFTALIERIVVFVNQFFSYLFSSHIEITFPPKKDHLDRMRINAEKAISEHRERHSKSPFISEKDGVIPSREELLKKESTPLQFTHGFAEVQGPREHMEDAHFYQEIPEGMLAGVFDGHGGRDVADYASQIFAQQFSNVLEDHYGDVYVAFTHLIDQIHKIVIKNNLWDHIGSTAVVCFVDKETHAIYTATLGDSEANIYREIDGQLVSIPLSCVRDWTSKKDLARLMKARNRPDIAWWEKFPMSAKYRRSNLDSGGVNVSRAIGDFYQTGTEENPIVVHKPKVSVHKLRPKDLVVLACDGLKDYVLETDITKIVKENYHSKCEEIAQKLVNFAIFENEAKDNVTVLTIKV